MIYQNKANELNFIVGKTIVNEIIENANISKIIYEEQAKQNGDNSDMLILGSIFQAGKIEGIRKERNRKKLGIQNIY